MMLSMKQNESRRAITAFSQERTTSVDLAFIYVSYVAAKHMAASLQMAITPALTRLSPSRNTYDDGTPDIFARNH